MKSKLLLFIALVSVGSLALADLPSKDVVTGKLKADFAASQVPQLANLGIVTVGWSLKNCVGYSAVKDCNSSDSVMAKFTIIDGLIRLDFLNKSYTFANAPTLGSLGGPSDKKDGDNVYIRVNAAGDLMIEESAAMSALKGNGDVAEPAVVKPTSGAYAYFVCPANG